jgi:hypothetical protein
VSVLLLQLSINYLTYISPKSLPWSPANQHIPTIINQFYFCICLSPIPIILTWPVLSRSFCLYAYFIHYDALWYPSNYDILRWILCLITLTCYLSMKHFTCFLFALKILTHTYLKRIPIIHQFTFTFRLAQALHLLNPMSVYVIIKFPLLTLIYIFSYDTPRIMILCLYVRIILTWPVIGSFAFLSSFWYFIIEINELCESVLNRLYEPNLIQL